MKTTTLERMEVATSAVTEKITTLATEAKLILGYSKLADRVLSPVRLATVLKELEINPFSDSSVEKYKTEKVAELREERKSARKRTGWRAYSEKISWKTFNISAYKKTIPEFALRKAIQVKQACPAVEIMIDELIVKKTQPIRKDFDPFLVVKLGEEKYYIEVWDEAKFENKLY